MKNQTEQTKSITLIKRCNIQRRTRQYLLWGTLAVAQVKNTVFLTDLSWLMSLQICFGINYAEPLSKVCVCSVIPHLQGFSYLSSDMKRMNKNILLVTERKTIFPAAGNTRHVLHSLCNRSCRRFCSAPLWPGGCRGCLHFHHCSM